MNTTTRATFSTATAAHASTAVVPLLTPSGIIMPARQSQAARTHQQAIAEAYAEALADPSKRMTIHAPHQREAWLAKQWLDDQRRTLIVLHGIMPYFVDREVTTEEAVRSFHPALTTRHAKTPARVPVSALHNEPHLIWSLTENLWFRLVHDWTHYLTGADDSFDGELRVTHHTLAGIDSLPLRQILASEIIGQAAYRLEYGQFPKRQVIAPAVLELI